MENVVVITESNFEGEISNNTGLALIDFWAEWCGPCQMMLPILGNFAKEIGWKVKVCKVNVDDNPGIAAKFRVMSIPTLILFKDGKAVEQAVWVHTVDQLKSLTEKHS